MTDYYAQVQGVFTNGRSWTTGRHITSNQSEAALATTWSNAWTAAWNDAAHGLNTLYVPGTKITGFTVATLGAGMLQRSKTPVPANLAGTDASTSQPTSTSVIVRYNSASVGRHFRGHQSLPAVGDDNVVNDFLVPAALTRIKAAMLAIMSAITADGSTYFVTNRVPTKGGTPAGDKVILLSPPFVRDKVGKQSKRYRKEISSFT